MLMVDLMIILFHLKLNKLYCIGAMNQLKMICFFIHIKMSYYWFNKEELLDKPKDRYHNCGGKEKAAKYYIKNKEILKEKVRKKYKNISAAEKEAKRKYKENRYKNATKMKIVQAKIVFTFA